MGKSEWAELLRKHYAIASVGSSTLMHQSDKGRNKRSQNYLLNNFPLENLYLLDEKDFLCLLDTKTDELSLQLPKPSDGTPNWGAARKVLNIYIRLCSMNKDVYPFYKLHKIESYFEVPLDNHIVEKIDELSGSIFHKNFKIIDLTKPKSDSIQISAAEIAAQKGVYRYELDTLFWNYKKLNS